MKIHDSTVTCLNIISHVDYRFGGISTSLPPLCDAMEREGRYESPVAAFCLPDEELREDENAPSILHHLPYSRSEWLLHRKLRDRFRAIASGASLLHIHGIWEAHCAVGSWFARRFKRPYVISAHGMLDSWALRQKRWKKTLYSYLCERHNLSSAACLRALTHNEARQYREFGLRNPIAVIPNGVVIPVGVTPSLFLEKFPELRGKTILLFLGRMHPKKGLFPLFRAFVKVVRQFPETQLVIAGPDCDGTEAQLRRLIDESGLHGSVTLTGPLTGPIKWSAYANAAVFVLPSYSEGFSIAVLEALGLGTPTLISENCYFPEIVTAEAGWITGVTEAEISAALRKFLSAPASQRRTMGANGTKLVQEQYSWTRVAGQLADVYDWLLGGALPQSCPVLTLPTP